MGTEAEGSARGWGDEVAWRPGQEFVVEETTKTDASRTFVSLHHHTTFSFLDGFGPPDDHAEVAARGGFAAMAQTDHGNVSGHVQHRDACNERGIKPIYGCELYTGPVDKENRRQKKNHLTVLAADSQGYKNLLQIVTRSWDPDEGFYYEPTVSRKMLEEHGDGLIVMSGCTASLLACSAVGGKHIPPEEASYARARSVAKWMRKLFGDRFYLEVQIFPELPEVHEINQIYEQLGKDLGIPLVATGDVHVPGPDDQDMRQILHHVRAGGRMTLEEMEQEFDYTIPCYLPDTDRDIYEKLRRTGLSKKASIEAVENTAIVADRCNVELPTMPVPEFPKPEGEDAKSLFSAWMNEGWKYRGLHRLSKTEKKEYLDRAKRELEVIEVKDYYDYFLIVADMVQFAKDSGIAVGPGRGSVAASLVAWILRITEVNPMLYPNLVFERFIDVTRQDLPDIDLDFDPERVGEIDDYLTQKYGEDRVSHIATFSHYKSKNSLDDVARVHGIPIYKVATVKDNIIERSSGDLRASATILDSIEMFDRVREVFDEYPELYQATKLEGNLKGIGVHAAGIVVSSLPINEVAAIYSKDVKGERTRVVSMDKYDSEKVGLVKIDVLKLKTMTLLKVACDLAGMSLQDMYDIPLDDEEVIRGFQENDVIGVFQFDGWAARLVNSMLQPDNFMEVADVNALARPGPLHNNAVTEYIEVKRGKQREGARRFHPLVQEITKYTKNQVVYQEQILRIVMEVGNFSWTHAAYIRKIISRKIGEQEFNRQWETFRDGAVENGLTEKEADEVWRACITAGSYAFNVAHSVSYGLLAWWTMWFKRHYPQAFYVGALRAFGDKEKLLKIMKDAIRHGIDISPPDPDLSTLSWQPEGKKGLLAGFTEVPGIGEKQAQSMVDYRESLKADQPDREMTWRDYLRVKGIGPKTVDKIQEFVNSDDPFDIYLLSRRISAVKKAIEDGDLQAPMPTHEASEIPYQATNYDEDVIWVGRVLTRDLHDIYEMHFSRTGKTLDPKKTKDPHLSEYVTMRCMDDEEVCYVATDRWRYPKMKESIWGLNPDTDVIVVAGVKRGFQTARKIYAKKIWVVDASDI